MDTYTNAVNNSDRCNDADQGILCYKQELEKQKAINAELRSRIALTAYIDRLLREDLPLLRDEEPKVEEPPASPPQVASAQAEWDNPRDCDLARTDTRFERVCHVFHQEWFGIRAAAGFVPGHKLAIPCQTTWSTQDLRQIADEMTRRGTRAVIMHGMSVAMGQLAKALAQTGDLDTYLVWHGTTNQWANKDELELACLAIELNNKGVFRSVHAIRCGMHEVFGSNAFVPQLVNMPPAIRNVAAHRTHHDGAVLLCPSWNDIRKNLYTNILAGALAPSVSRIQVLASTVAPPRSLRAKIEWVRHRSQVETIQLMANSDLVANVTVVDCHPMVNVEALAVDTPTIEGPLFLDALEDHPYKTLVRVENPISVSDVRNAIEKVLAVPRLELVQLLRDYREQLTNLSLARYLEFVGASL